ncbi:hypothetical protein HT136_00345 [Novosphingobium profundi]|uniref:hypothetical protein n=1 Tax=Novosphingobium profundi TaxID=1774954 RepID=UPI001BDA07CA|nr:hypothetical protein [Novosphingobium profundi]MBT0666816.1 hypothetical protein [Novosphingobium profundi]
MPERMRGQPLVAFVAVLAGWLGGRVATLDPVSLLHVPLQSAAYLPRSYKALPVSDRGQSDFSVDGPQSYASLGEADGWRGRSEALEDLPRASASELIRLLAALLDNRGRGASGPYPELPPRGVGDPARGGPADFYLAPGTSGFDLGEVMPAGFAPAPRGAGAASGTGATPASTAYDPQAPQVRPRRWSADAWALVRSGEGAVSGSGTLPSTYGGSQAGAVLRYRLRPSSGHRPTGYMRTTAALGEVQESAAALGFAVRPLPRVPLSAMVEGRLTNGLGGNRVQPAALVTSELPPFEVVEGVRAEIYGQAGYVAGRYATAFGDGQIRLDRGFARLGPFDARLGGGVWGGAQKGAARLDAGPSMVLAGPLGKRYFGRLALDWRLRVAGDAAPGSGPALTLSAGF